MSNSGYNSRTGTWKTSIFAILSHSLAAISAPVKSSSFVNTFSPLHGQYVSSHDSETAMRLVLIPAGYKCHITAQKLYITDRIPNTKYFSGVTNTVSTILSSLG
jgi:hypothetical protein